MERELGSGAGRTSAAEMASFDSPPPPQQPLGLEKLNQSLIGSLEEQSEVLPKKCRDAFARAAEYAAHPTLKDDVIQLQTRIGLDHPADITAAYILMLLAVSNTAKGRPSKLLSKPQPNQPPIHPPLPTPQAIPFTPTSRMTLQTFFPLSTYLHPSDLTKIPPNSPLSNLFQTHTLKTLPPSTHNLLTLYSTSSLPLKLYTSPLHPLQLSELGSLGLRCLTIFTKDIQKVRRDIYPPNDYKDILEFTLHGEKRLFIKRLRENVNKRYFIFNTIRV